MAVEELRVELTSETATRIVVAQAHLLEDDFLFLLENVCIERRVHRDVGQHFEAGHQTLRRQRDVVIGVVPRGAGVHTAADALDVTLDKSTRPRRRAPKQHVLEVVRETQLGRRLVARSSAHP